MKYPANSIALNEARLYAIDSIDHTYDYKGFEDKHKKMQRITTGKFVQLWMCEYCRINNIKHTKDKSSPLLADNFDLVISGYNVDCKTTVINGLEGQVSKNHDKANDVDIYAFFKTDVSCSYIQPLGMIKKEKLHSISKKINKDEAIPGTKMKQRFDYSYFADINLLIDFDTSMKFLSITEKNTEESKYEN